MNKVNTLLILLFCLICVREAVAQNDSVRFFIKIDSTQNGVRMGQEVVVRYICTAQYDSILPPHFEVPVKIIKESTPHRVGKSITNGVLTDICEVGLEYIVQFQEEGEYKLPLSVVRIAGKEYKTLSASLSVKPAIADVKGVKCSISIRPKCPRKGERFLVTLYCNRQPDSKVPVVLLNGTPMEPTGTGYSSTNGEEEHRFMYTAQMQEKGNNVVSVEGLTFGGTPYSVLDTEIEAAGDRSSSERSFIIFLFTYMPLVYVLAWLRFRKESKEELAIFVLTHHRLNLSAGKALTHYGFPLAISILPAMFFYFYIFSDNVNFFPLFWVVAVMLGLVFISYRRQRSKLNFEPIRNHLAVRHIHSLIEKVAMKHNWMIDYEGRDCVVMHTVRSFPSLSWGEQVFLVFDKGQVWVCSVNNLNKRSVASSFGYTKRNIRLLKEAIENRQHK